MAIVSIETAGESSRKSSNVALAIMHVIGKSSNVALAIMHDGHLTCVSKVIFFNDSKQIVHSIVS